MVKRIFLVVYIGGWTICRPPDLWSNRCRAAVPINTALFNELVGLRWCGRLLVAKEQTAEQGIHHVPEKWPAVTRALFSFDLCPVPCQVYVMVLREIGARVPNIPQDRVHKHEARFKDVEVYLIPKNRTQMFQSLDFVDVNAGCASSVLHKPVDAAHKYQDHAHVEGNKR